MCTSTVPFDDLRPYTDAEIPAAMHRMASDPAFGTVARYIWPDKTIEEARTFICQFTNVYDFQHKVMLDACLQILKRSVSQLSWSGLTGLTPGKGYLFVSNHRDIVLDATILQYVLSINQLPTTQITFGNNLMQPGFMTDFGKANKMFKVMRKKNNELKAFLQHSKILSEYIRTHIAGGESVWIAQRNGRTKDGFDSTDQGLINMFSLSGGKNLAESMEELHILPMAVSYQSEPCDLFTAREVYLSRDGAVYEKEPGEDLQSIITGIQQPKGHMHIAFCEPITEEFLSTIAHLQHRNEFNKALAEEIDRRIYAAYRCHDTQYIALDLLEGTENHADRYTPEARQQFEAHAEQLYDMVPGGDRQVLREILLKIYAGPLLQKQG